MTRHSRSPVNWVAQGRNDARPECTMGKSTPKASVTRCELPG